MPEQDQIVINTGPIIALIAALGDLSMLASLYSRIVVPREVADEVLAGGRAGCEFRSKTRRDVEPDGGERFELREGQVLIHCVGGYRRILRKAVRR